jgi:hypothetical protein
MHSQSTTGKGSFWREDQITQETTKSEFGAATIRAR